MKIEVVKGDITKIEVDAIVNAGNTSLLGGGGVDGAIHRAGGKEILDECIKIRNKQGRCKVGEAVYTTAGKLNAQYVIHTVGPTWNNGKSDEQNKLANCYRNIIRLAEELDINSLAIPNISTGVYRYPKLQAAEIAIHSIRTNTSSSIEKVLFVCFDEENYNIYKAMLDSKLH